jgi:hypothetical protein
MKMREYSRYTSCNYLENRLGLDYNAVYRIVKEDAIDICIGTKKGEMTFPNFTSISIPLEGNEIISFKIEEEKYNSIFKEELQYLEPLRNKPCFLCDRDHYYIDSQKKNRLFYIRYDLETKALTRNEIEIISKITSSIFIIKKNNKRLIKDLLGMNGTSPFVRELEQFKIDENIRDMIESISGSCSTDFGLIEKLIDFFPNSILEETHRDDNSSWSSSNVTKYYTLSDDDRILSVRTFRCDIDDYAVEIEFGNIPLEHYDSRFPTTQLNIDKVQDKLEKKEKLEQISKNGRIQCIPFEFYEQNLRTNDYFLDFSIETVLNLEIELIEKEYVVLSKKYHYDSELGLNLK